MITKEIIEINHSNFPIDYNESVNIMEKRIMNIYSEKNRELIWFLNHDNIYTMGTSANKSEIHKDVKIPIISTNRGGKTTYHGPGQRIVYFLINLNKRKKDIRKLINSIEKSIIQFLENYKIKAKNDKKNIGIWVKDKKIAAIGIRVSRWIAYHGCSINISNNLNQYLKIIPCGLDNKKVTSISELISVKPKKFENNLANIFIKNINSI